MARFEEEQRIYIPGEDHHGRIVSVCDFDENDPWAVQVYEIAVDGNDLATIVLPEALVAEV